MTIDCNVAFELEDFLSGEGVFVSMVDGSPRHPDSYGTITEPDKFYAAAKKCVHSDEEIAFAVDYWIGHSSIGMGLKVAALLWKELLDDKRRSA